MVGDDILKKYIVVIMLCLVLCGCGCSKKKTTSKKVEESYIGNEDVSYTLSISCGNYAKDSKVTLNKGIFMIKKKFNLLYQKKYLC